MNPFFWTGLGFRKLGKELLQINGQRGIWIDVGAHVGQETYLQARNSPSLTVYAFEPNWKVAAKMMGRLANFIVLPLAVSDTDGLAELYINAFDQASSLLPFDPAGLQNWKGKEDLRVERKARVQTIRLDSFMELMELESVDYLKIDAQGSDFSVIRSAGSRLRDIRRIRMEVDLNPIRLYRGSAGRDEVVNYLAERGFTLAGASRQSYDQEENLTFVKRDGNPEGH